MNIAGVSKYYILLFKNYKNDLQEVTRAGEGKFVIRQHRTTPILAHSYRGNRYFNYYL